MMLDPRPPKKEPKNPDIKAPSKGATITDKYISKKLKHFYVALSQSDPSFKIEDHSLQPMKLTHPYSLLLSNFTSKRKRDFVRIIVKLKSLEKYCFVNPSKLTFESEKGNNSSIFLMCKQKEKRNSKRMST